VSDVEEDFFQSGGTETVAEDFKVILSPLKRLKKDW